MNTVTLGRRPTIVFLERLRRAGRFHLGRPIAILDAGSGRGDMLQAVADWAARRGVAVRLTGVDLNPWSAKAAAEAWRGGAPVRWITGDVFDHGPRADVVLSSLFTHHLADSDIVRFLRWMEEKAELGWFINDLRRHPAPYYGFGLLAGVARWHRFVRHDGPVSIARSFVPADWRGYLAEAEISAVPERRFAFRLCVARDKSA